MLYQIWMEGFNITGGQAGASYVGSMEGKDFRDAVINWYDQHPDINFNAEHLSYWGCGLFSNEAQARQTFG